MSYLRHFFDFTNFRSNLPAAHFCSIYCSQAQQPLQRRLPHPRYPYPNCHTHRHKVTRFYPHRSAPKTHGFMYTLNISHKRSTTLLPRCRLQNHTHLCYTTTSHMKYQRLPCLDADYRIECPPRVYIHMPTTMS